MVMLLSWLLSLFYYVPICKKTKMKSTDQTMQAYHIGKYFLHHELGDVNDE
ncbi:hypothetical protein AB434_1634 [Heyndrickxia coagulans]|uniref:Uncharacterized protein n=1 Tax=Heyndrickxia coagulans TaxID=1398 RepID=A0A0C5CSR8_HEYCO|nr:hypothetical protein SB48_HM08orf05894 [Heyndrickxia coagulans]AKN54039.1 hypothetical protein AB434_1634 [Heyndrickxia coagulans]KWZ76563.1 hypothetical protein HMPREF3213_03738 [Heyndrickxia coagulans]KYC60292.1 hypothetical protein B4100_0979 [Heyndrickxia coagulans]KYC69864.1 hypothetical protein B4096_0916 [Heyndrickxia coagulans]